jgi:hypothetical protein
VVGTFNEPTDRAPNGAEPAITEVAAVPEPSSMVLLALGGAAVAGHWYRRRRSA